MRDINLMSSTFIPDLSFENSNVKILVHIPKLSILANQDIFEIELKKKKLIGIKSFLLWASYLTTTLNSTKANSEFCILFHL